LQRFVSRLPLNVVKEMFFTANPISAERAARIGIVNAIVPVTELEERSYAMARVITTRSALAIAGLREQLRILSDESVAISPSDVRISARHPPRHLFWPGLRRRYPRVS
jgi:methylmalonyl-CoA decarboxylase